MKKVKFHKKRNKKEKLVKKSKIFVFVIDIGLILIKIFILIIIIFLLFKFRRNKIKETEINDPNEIMYKGTRIQKNKLLVDYFSRISIEEQNKDHERKTLDKLFNLPDYTYENNIKNDIKNQFMNFFSKLKKKNINKLETFFIAQNCYFGNCIITLNNVIFYCEIVGCHKIIFTDHHSLIRHPIYIEKLNITITPHSKVNCYDDTTLCPTFKKWDPFYPTFIKSQIRTQYIREEILRNIPQVKTDPDDLYINIRGGDIFDTMIVARYSQPPLCFYEKVINDNKFKNIYIISNDRKNVVLDALINKYNNIVFNHTDYKTDIAMLVFIDYVKNFVGCIITFTNLILNIKFIQ